MTKRLRPLALQATAAERAEKLGVEIARLQAAIATLDLARLAERRTEAEARRAATAEEHALEEKIDSARRRARTRRRGAHRFCGRPRAGDRCALPVAQRRRAHRAASRVGRVAHGGDAFRARGRARVRPVGVGRDGDRCA